jgi:hypothetical protein
LKPGNTDKITTYRDLEEFDNAYERGLISKMATYLIGPQKNEDSGG